MEDPNYTLWILAALSWYFAALYGLWLLIKIIFFKKANPETFWRKYNLK